MIDSADHCTHALPVTGATCLLFSDASCGTFVIDLRQDLLGDWIVMQRWSGSGGGQRAGGKREIVAGHEDGLLLLRKIASQKEQQGFRRIEAHHVRDTA